MLNSEYPPLGGGMGNANKYLYEELKEHDDLSIDIITASTDKKKIEKSELGDIVYLNIGKKGKNAHYQSTKDLLTYSLKSFSQAKKQLKEKKYGLIVAWSSLPAGFISWRLSKKFCTPYIVLLRGADVPFYSKRWRNFDRFLFKRLAKIIWKNAKAVIANSEGLKKLALKTAPRQKISVIPNGVDLKKFQSLPKKKQKLFTILYVGRLTKRKGINYLIKAFCKLNKNKDCKLILAGDGNFREKLEKQVKKSGHKNFVEFIGILNHDQLIKIYRSSDVFVLPSLNEGMSNTLLEAMASGLPIITTDVGGTKELFCDNGYVIRKKSSEDIFEALKKLKSDIELLKEMGAKSLEKVKGFSWEKVAESFANVFRKKEKIKICFTSIGGYAFVDPEKCKIRGGMELQLYLLAKHLAKNKNFEIYFIVGDFGQKKIEKFNNIFFVKSVTPKQKDSKLKKLFYALKLWFIFKKINADIYFTSSANAIAGLTCLFCKLHKKIHIHRTANEKDINGLWVKNNGILGKIYEYGLKNSDLILTQHEDHKKMLKKEYGKSSIVFRNVFEVKEIKHEKKEFFLWVSRCEKWKQPELFLSLAKKHPNNKFVMIMPKSNEIKLWKEIKEKTEKIKNLHFIEQVPFNEIQHYFNKAKIFINSSEYEGFPNTFLQTGLSQTPVLSLNINPENFITKYDCGYFCNNNFEEMVKNLKKMLMNEEILNKKGENIFEYVKKYHNIEKGVNQLEKIICRITHFK